MIIFVCKAEFSLITLLPEQKGINKTLFIEIIETGKILVIKWYWMAITLSQVHLSFNSRRKRMTSRMTRNNERRSPAMDLTAQIQLGMPHTLTVQNGPFLLPLSCYVMMTTFRNT